MAAAMPVAGPEVMEAGCLEASWAAGVVMEGG